MSNSKFKVLRRVKGLVDGDAAKGKAPSINQPGDIVTLDSDDERIEALLKSKVIEQVSPASTKSNNKSTAATGNSSTKDKQQEDKPFDPAALPAMSVEDLRKLAVDELSFDAASIAKFTKDELLALIAEAIAKG